MYQVEFTMARIFSFRGFTLSSCAEVSVWSSWRSSILMRETDVDLMHRANGINGVNGTFDEEGIFTQA